MKTNVAR